MEVKVAMWTFAGLFSILVITNAAAQSCPANNLQIIISRQVCKKFMFDVNLSKSTWCWLCHCVHSCIRWWWDSTRLMHFSLSLEFSHLA